jgi:hypothetical protein
MAGPSPAEEWSRKAAEEFRFGPQAGTRLNKSSHDDRLRLTT